MSERTSSALSSSPLAPRGAPAARSAAVRLIALLSLGGVLAVMLGGCAPRFNWREVRADEAGYRVMFPDRPDSVTRTIHLEALAVDMTMQGTRVEGMTFAVGTIRLPATATPGATDATGTDPTGPAPSGTASSGASSGAGTGSGTGTDAATGAAATSPPGDAAAMEGRRARALEAMRTQMVRNIHGHEMRTEGVEVTLIDGAGQRVGSTEEAMAVEAVGERPQAGRAAQAGEGTGSAGVGTAPAAGDTLQLNGRFVGRGDHVYQVIVLGPHIDAEQAATFLESFKLLR